MKAYMKRLAVTAGVAVLTTAGALAQDSGPLLDALVKKGVLSNQEADDIRVNLTKEYNTSSAGKLQLDSFISKLKIYGDARLRYQWQNAESRTVPINNADRDRYRYRIRLGAEYVYDEHWSAGFRLETSDASDSTNVDFGRYFDKYGNELNVGLVYLEYQNKFSLFDESHNVADGKNFKTVTDPGLNVGFDARVGKHLKQFMMCDAFWYSDINPEGASEEMTFSNVGIDGLSFAARGGEFITSVGRNDQSGTDFFASNTSGASEADGFLLVGQLEGKYAWGSGTNIRVAPMYLGETTGSLFNQEVDSPSTTSIVATTNGPVAPIAGTNPYPYLGRLDVVAVPVEINWKMFNLPNRVFGTYGTNLDSGDRLKALGINKHTGGQDFFWNAGYEIGQNKVKGDWLLGAEWRWLGAGSYTTNLTDSNWASNGLNQQGFVLRSGYNITDFLLAQVTYYHSNPINGNTAAGSPNNPSGGSAMYSTTAYPGGTLPFYGQVDILQADLTWKF